MAWTLQQLKDARPKDADPPPVRHSLHLGEWLDKHCRHKAKLVSGDAVNGRPPGTGPWAQKLIAKVGYLKYMCMTTLERDYQVRKFKRREFTQKKLEDAERRRIENTTKGKP